MDLVKDFGLCPKRKEENQRRIFNQENYVGIHEFSEDHSSFGVGDRFEEGKEDDQGGY